MAQGLQVFNASGDMRLEVTDRISRVISTGTFTVPWLGAAVTIYFSGLQANSEWLVVATGGGAVNIFNGGFTVVDSVSVGDQGYAIYRR